MAYWGSGQAGGWSGNVSGVQRGRAYDGWDYDELGRVYDAALVKRFFDLGYSNQQYLELLLAVSMKTLSNYVNHAANTPLDQAFAAQVQAA